MSYSVQSGDTLSKIAKDNGTTVDALLRGNPQITDRNMIYPGQKISTPKAKTSGAAKPSNECVESCPAAAPKKNPKLDLRESSKEQIFEALQENCKNISKVSTRPNDKGVENVVIPSKKDAEKNIKACLSKYKLTNSDGKYAKKILTHWNRNELNEMPVYLGNLQNFEQDFAKLGYKVEMYPASESVFHTFKNESATKWKVLDQNGVATGFEYVFNGKGDIVTNVEDAGTYNISSGAARHAWNDVTPYYRFGSGPADSTTMSQRISRTSDGAAIKYNDAKDASVDWAKESIIEPGKKAANAIKQWTSDGATKFSEWWND